MPVTGNGKNLKKCKGRTAFVPSPLLLFTKMIIQNKDNRTGFQAAAQVSLVDPVALFTFVHDKKMLSKILTSPCGAKNQNPRPFRHFQWPDPKNLRPFELFRFVPLCFAKKFSSSALPRVQRIPRSILSLVQFSCSPRWNCIATIAILA